MTHSTSVAGKDRARGTSDHNEIYELIESFRQSAEARLPETRHGMGIEPCRPRGGDTIEIFATSEDPLLAG